MTEASVVTHDPQSPEAWREHILKYGYVIVHDVVPKENLSAVIDDIWKHTGASPDDPDSWYKPDIIKPSGMVEMYHYQSLWNNRENPQSTRSFAPSTGQISFGCQSIGRISNHPRTWAIPNTITKE